LQDLSRKNTNDDDDNDEKIDVLRLVTYKNYDHKTRVQTAYIQILWTTYSARKLGKYTNEIGSSQIRVCNIKHVSQIKQVMAEFTIPFDTIIIGYCKDDLHSQVLDSYFFIILYQS